MVLSRSRCSLIAIFCLTMFAALVFAPKVALGADEVAQVLMLKKVFASPVDQWSQIMHDNRQLIDNSFFERVEQRIRWSLDNGQVDDAVRFAYVGDIASGLTKRQSSYRLQMSQLFRRLGNLPMAMDLVNNILISEPTNQEARFYQASLLQDGGDLINSYPIYEQLASEGYRRAECYYRMALLELPRQEIELAKQHLESALKLQADHQGARKELDRLNLMLANASFIPNSNSDASVLPFGSLDTPAATGFNESQVSELLSSADAARAAGELDRALDLYQSTLKLNPNLTSSYTYMGTIYYQQHDLEAAIRNLTMAAKLAPNNADVQRYLGYCFEGRYDENGEVTNLAKAADCYTKSQSLNPSNEFIELDVKRIQEKKSLYI